MHELVRDRRMPRSGVDLDCSLRLPTQRVLIYHPNTDVERTGKLTLTHNIVAQALQNSRKTHLGSQSNWVGLSSPVYLNTS